MPYVIRIDSPDAPHGAGSATRVSVVGPFATDDAAADFFRIIDADGGDVENPRNPHDDPRWWVLDRVPVGFVKSFGPYAPASASSSEKYHYVAALTYDLDGRTGVVFYGRFLDDVEAVRFGPALTKAEWQTCRLDPLVVHFVAPEDWSVGGEA